MGVDILGLLYKCRTFQQPPCIFLARLLNHCRDWGMEPVFVFDGKTPAEKRTTCSLRKKQRDRDRDRDRERDQDYEGEAADTTISPIAGEERNRIKQFLYATGCLSINAEGEADTVLATLARRGEIAAVLSSDLDFLPRGCPLLLMPTEDPHQWNSIRLQTVLETAQLTYDAFVTMCVLMGTDYNPSLPTVSYQTAYWTMRFDTLQTPLADILKKVGIRDPCLWERAAVLLRGEEDTTAATALSPRQWEKYCVGPPPLEAESLLGMRADPAFQMADLSDTEFTRLLQPWLPRPPSTASVSHPT